jgi:hypothetical protein
VETLVSTPVRPVELEDTPSSKAARKLPHFLHIFSGDTKTTVASHV